MAVDNSFLIKKIQSRTKMFVAYSAITNMPLVTCDEETANDQVWIFQTKELLEEKAKEEREAAKKDKKTSGQEAEEQSEQDSGQADSFMPEAGEEPDWDDVTKGGTPFEDGESKDTSKAVKSDAKDISKPVSSKNVTDGKGEE